MIRFTTLRWKNFLSTGNVFTEINLNSKDITLIIGQNGAGKSTVLDALTFALFGKPFRKINKPQLVNTITNKNLLVELEFSIGTIEYKVVRGLKPTVFEVYQNNSLLNQSAESKDYQEILEKQILKVNMKSFCQVVILGSATFQPFMQLTAWQRREIIEDLLDLQIFTVMNSLLKDKVTQNTNDITDCINKKNIAQSKIEISKDYLKELQSNNEKLVKNKLEIIKETTDKIKDCEIKFESFNNQITKLKEQITDNENISKKVDKLTKLRHQIHAKMALLDADVKFFNENDSCPTCKQTIEEEFRNKTLSEKQNQIKQIEDGLQKLSEEYETCQKRLKEIIDVNNEIQKIEINKIETKATINSLTKYQQQLNSEIENIKNIDSETSDNKIIEYEKELENIELTYNELIEDKNVLLAAGSLLKDTGIKAKIIKQYVPIINKLINKYLSAMDFFVSFELDENFEETIKSRYRDNFTYSSFSEGEKQKIDLALLFTWRAVAKLRNSVNTNLLIMDEVLDSSLDSNATDYLLNIINNIAKDNNIFIISHKENMNEKFTNVLRFKKVKNFSQLEA